MEGCRIKTVGILYIKESPKNHYNLNYKNKIKHLNYLHSICM
jgi:hypothetical protein